MLTAIIPQISDIKLLDNALPFSLSDFKLDPGITAILPIAYDIFSENGFLCGSLPIKYITADLAYEEYKIKARKNCIEISALSARGLMYALFTLSELAIVNGGKLSEFDAHDLPVLPLRGLSDDISRGQISTLEDFFSVIRRLARYKYNTYMPYMEDVFKYECCEAWGRYSDGLSKTEWEIIIKYAKSYQLEVRPIVNLLGHFDKLCFIKELQPLALKLKDGSVSSVMDPTNKNVRLLISAMLKEIVACFGEGVIHCGGDEPTALTEVFGKEEGGRLFIEHYTFISKELQKLNCTMMMYADFFAPPWGDYAVPVDRAKELPPKTDFVFWDYAVRQEYPFIDALHNQKISLYLSPGSWTWNRFSCDIRTCYGNTKGLLSSDKGRSKGMIMSSWGDGGDTLRELTWPGVLIGANFCWAPSSSYSFEEFYKLYHLSFFGLDEKQAALLEPIYHHDSILKREDQFTLHKEFFRDPFEPVPFMDIENIGILQAAMKKARADLNSLAPLRNASALNALSLTVERALFTANRLAMLPQAIPSTVEETIPYSKNAMLLAGELSTVKELHKKLWFANNRNSEWELCACQYDDLYDKLMAFARQARFRKMHK